MQKDQQGGPLLTATEAADYLKISRRQFDRLNLERIRIGRLPRWRVSTLEAYIEANIEAVPPPALKRPTATKQPRAKRRRSAASNTEEWLSAVRARL